MADNLVGEEIARWDRQINEKSKTYLEILFIN
jgi:hypothetical protein